MNGAKLTVCIPAYNRPDFLRDALESLCDQGMPRDTYCVLVSDDASPAPLHEVCASFEDRLQIIYDRSASNIGHLANFARAESLARTPYVSFLSHDDVVAPGQLGRAVGVLDGSADTVLVASLALVQSHPGSVDTRLHGLFLRGAQHPQYAGTYRWDRVEWFALSLISTPLSLIGSVFRREVFERCKQWLKFPIWHDRLMLAEMGLHGSVQSLPWIGGYYRVSADQLSGQLMRQDNAEFVASSELVLTMSAQASAPVIEFWIDHLCAAPPADRAYYLRQLRSALPEGQFAAIRQTCEHRLGTRLPLTRLERFRVPSPVAKLIRDLDRVFAGPR